MKNLFAFFTAVTLCLPGMSANAGEFTDLGAMISAARTSYVTMASHKDMRGAEQQKLVKDTADAVSHKLAKMKAPAGKEGQFKELVETWDAFKETREKELVPALIEGNAEAAQRFADIQRERITKCLILSGVLDY